MKRILISIPPELLTQIDQYCKDNQYNRSELIRHALRLLVIKENEKSNQKTV